MSSMSPFKLESNIYVCLTRVQYVPVLHICLIPPHILLRNASYAVGMLHGAMHRFIARSAASSKFGHEFRQPPLRIRFVAELR